MLSRIALHLCLFIFWVQTFDYMPGENWQLRAVLVRSPPNKRKNLLFFSSQVEKVAPCCLPELLPCCRCLLWSIALHSLWDANTARTAHRIDHKPEINVRVEENCCSAVIQVKVRALPFCSALDWARLWWLQSASLRLQRELKLEFWPGSRQDEWDCNYWQIFAMVLGFKYRFMSQVT